MEQIVSGLDFLRQTGKVACYESRFWTAAEERKKRDEQNRASNLGEFIRDVNEEKRADQAITA